MTTGQGVSRAGTGAVTPITADPVAFSTAPELADRAAAETLLRQKEWEDACRALRRDPTLPIHYTFQDAQPWARMLRDEAGGRPHHEVVVGCAWGKGRWQVRQGLDFKRVSDRVRLTVPGEFESVTLAARVRVDALPNKNNSLMMADGWEAGELHWQIGSDGMLILGVQEPPGLPPPVPPKTKGSHYHAAGVFTPERFGRWSHLATVYDRAAGRVSHGVDGQRVSHEPVEYDVPLRVGDASVGSWDVASYRNNIPIRNYNGGLDEFMFFARALFGPEVERLDAQGRPPL